MQSFNANLLTTSARRRNWTRSNTTTATGIAQRGEEVNTPYALCSVARCGNIGITYRIRANRTPLWANLNKTPLFFHKSPLFEQKLHD